MAEYKIIARFKVNEKCLVTDEDVNNYLRKWCEKNQIGDLGYLNIYEVKPYLTPDEMDKAHKILTKMLMLSENDHDKQLLGCVLGILK